MESIMFMLYFLVTRMCNAAYIPDDKLNVAPSHERAVSEQETRPSSTNISQKQLFPINNLKNCQENSNKGLSDTLLGGLSSSLLSVLSTNRESYMSEGGDGYEDKSEYDGGSFTASIKAGSQVLGNPSDTSENQGSVIDADVGILGTNNNDGNDESSDNPGSLVDADDLNFGDIEKETKDNTTENQEALVHADVDVLNGEQLLNKDMYRVFPHILGKGISAGKENNEGINARIGKTKSKKNINLRSCESCRDNIDDYESDSSESQETLIYYVDVGILNCDDEESNSNYEYDEEQGSLVDVDVGVGNGEQLLKKDNDLTENLAKGTKAGKENIEDFNASFHSTKIIKLKLCESCRDNIDDESDTHPGTLIDADVEVLKSDNDKHDSNVKSTKNEGSLVDTDVDVLNGEQPPLTDTLGGVIGGFGNNIEDFTTNTRIRRSNVEMVSSNEKNGNSLDIIVVEEFGVADTDIVDKNNKYITEHGETNYRIDERSTYDSSNKKIEVMSKERDALLTANNNYYSHGNAELQNEDYLIKSSNAFLFELIMDESNGHKNQKTIASGRGLFGEYRIAQSANKKEIKDDQVIKFISSLTGKESNFESTNDESYIRGIEEQSLVVIVSADNQDDGHGESIHSSTSENDDYLKTVKTESTNLGMHSCIQNYGCEGQIIFNGESGHSGDSLTKQIHFPTKHAKSPNKISFHDPGNQYELERVGYINHDNQRGFTGFWPLTYLPFPGRHMISKTLAKKNVQYGILHHIESRDNLFHQTEPPSKKPLSSTMLRQIQNPPMAKYRQFPQSIAGSSLYGSYASAQTVPNYGYGHGGVVEQEGTEISSGEEVIDETIASL